jgi:hypothetical protein
MALTIERKFGRTALVATLADPRQFVSKTTEGKARAARNA